MGTSRSCQVSRWKGSTNQRKRCQRRLFLFYFSAIDHANENEQNEIAEFLVASEELREDAETEERPGTSRKSSEQGSHKAVRFSLS